MAFPNDRYWVGGAGGWLNTAKWSLTSGGAGGASIPDATNNVYFDANSGGGAVGDSGAAKFCLGFDTTGFTGSFNWSFRITVGGDFIIGSTLTSFSITNSVRLIGTNNILKSGLSTFTITYITLMNANTLYTLGSNFLASRNTNFSMGNTAGKLYVNGYSLTCGGLYDSQYYLTSGGSMTVKYIDAGTPPFISAASGSTVTLSFFSDGGGSMSSPNQVDLQTGSSIDKLVITSDIWQAIIVEIICSTKIANLEAYSLAGMSTYILSVKFRNLNTNTLTSLKLLGNSNSRIGLISDSTTHATLTVTDKCDCDWIGITDVNANSANGTIYYAGTNSTRNDGNNLGWTASNWIPKPTGNSILFGTSF